MENHFTLHLRLGHFVKRLDWNPPLLPAEFDEYKSPAWPQCACDSLNHLERMITLVIDIHQHRKIERIRRQLWIRRRADDADAICNPASREVRFEECNHFRLNVRGVHQSGWANRLC